MSIPVALHHRTTYRYERPVRLSPHVVRLRPAPHNRTAVPHYSLQVSPRPHFINWQQDPHGNHLARLVFPEPVQELVIDVALTAELTAVNPFDFFLEPEASEYPFDYGPAFRETQAAFFRPVGDHPLVAELAAQLRSQAARGTIDFLVQVNQAVHGLVRYVIRLEPGVQAPQETLVKGEGSCRDSAWLLVALLRRLGFAARFVSGYLIQLVPDTKPLEGPPGPERDFTDLHAWAEVYLPGAGWLGLDATSGLLAGEGHLPLACTPEPADAAPVSGLVEKCESMFDVAMSVARLATSPRVTAPYTPVQWQAVDALGAEVDRRLRAGDVRLTLGGEPTFVAADDMQGAEWNTEAQGPTKRARAGELIRRLRRRFAPGALLHTGTGKWYPGEQLPRWALTCVWRRDGEPIWREERLLADEARPAGHDAPLADRFIRALARRLAVSDQRVMPAYEDTWYHLWRERRLPSNVDPLRSNIDDPLERARLARIFEQGLGRVVGYALPLRAGAGGWQTGPWFLRAERLYLIPGDSPMGLRLPLDSLPWQVPPAVPDPAPQDPLEEQPPLPRQAQPSLSRAETAGTATDRAPRAGQSADWIVRTALCVEPRGGRLHVFLPPVPGAEAYLELVAAVERTAAELDAPVVVEGEAPPDDPRLLQFKVTPDPGVLEVNVHPAGDWRELSGLVEGLYEEARLCRLGAEKFMIDGRHSGTGGGNHIVLGGPTPADSPFLRRPDLLASLLTLWQNHPSLSYLFSGLFVGPTSQAPRIDEARHDSLYELEIALRHLAGARGGPPWLVDRALRNLLVDVTGNTHRTEFCIDKLYAPESAAGRRGLVELRGFEMPPHPQMSLVQQLLVRALVARCWSAPCDRPLVRWGTQLHDRFLLPHFVREDLQDVLADLARSGIAFDPAWFGPHFEFRFPVLGELACRGLQVELRQAIEPWPALGEEPGAGGTTRYVDSSLERLQVRVSGMTDPRHIVACNGIRLPLAPTGAAGEFVAGVRYRAWQPASCLHPAIGVHTPLVFDVVDTWSGCAVGGCTYPVAHPGGRAFETYPVNAREAEGRRAARFFPMGHTPGPMAARPAPASRDFPLTLDLRAIRPV